MKSIRNLLAEPLLLPGLIIILVNTSTSHSFFHVNSYKIVLMVLGLTLVALRNIPPIPSPISTAVPWKIWLVLAIPLLATIPGLVLYRLGFNYNFKYELATSLILMLWVVYLFRTTQQEQDINLLLQIIGIVIIYNAFWSVLEKTGSHPLSWGEPVRMVKATFGHRNYFSGFLIILLPLMAVFAVPKQLFPEKPNDIQQCTSPGDYRFFLAAFLAGAICLALAQTRAAIAACGIGLALTGYLYIRFFAPIRWRRRVLIVFGVLILIGVGLGALMLAFPDLFADNRFAKRFAQLFTVRAWLGRRLAWETALASIKASPLVGYGLGSSYNLFFNFVDPDARLFHHEHSYNHAHSEVLEFTQEGGIIGLLLLIAFWGWLIHRLVRLLKNPGISTISRKILIAICGGFLAYHIHGTFSVAPRMMVTKLPLFTLIAILLVLDALYNTEHSVKSDIEPTVGRRVVSGLPTLFVLLSAWMLYLPWASTQYQFNRIRRERPSYLQIRKLEQLTQLSPDIYALDYLSDRQIDYKQAGALKKTLERTERIIPHYRNLDYKKILQALFSGNLKEARRLGLVFQQRDRYFQPAINLMMALAVKTDDHTLFKEQFALSVRRHVFAHQLTDSLNADDVRILFLPGENPLSIEPDSGKLVFQWSEKLLGIIFDTAQKNMKAGGSTITEKNRYGAYLKQLILSQPWFQLQILPAWQEQSLTLMKLAADYHDLSRKWKEKKLEMERNFQQELRRTQPGQRRALYLQQQKILGSKQAEHGSQLQTYTEKLKPKTDWSRYLRKRQFAEKLTNSLMTIVFPAGR